MLTEKEKVMLTLFASGKATDKSINQLATLAGLSPAGAHKMLKKFADRGVLIGIRIGNALVFELNKKSALVKPLLQIALLPSTSLEDLKNILKPLDRDIEKKFKAEIIGIFGSYARGEQTTMSDVDILARFNSDASYFDFVGLSDFLEKKLQVNVDLVSEGGLRPELKGRILREVVGI